MNKNYRFLETFHSDHLFPHVNAQFSLFMTCFPESSASDHMGDWEMPQ